MGQVELEESVYEKYQLDPSCNFDTIQLMPLQLATDTDRPGRQLNTALA